MCAVVSTGFVVESAGWINALNSEQLSEAPARIVMEEADFDVAACLAQVRTGSDDAARELVEHLYPTVIKIVRKHLPRREQEEDLAQEIFLKMFANLASYNEVVPLVNWVSRIAVNASLNRIRWQKSRPEYRLADLGEEEAKVIEALRAEEPMNAAQKLHAKDLTDKLLAALSPEDALVLRMLEMEGFTVEDISERTGWSRTLVRVRAFRARRKLRQRFKGLWEEGEL